MMVGGENEGDEEIVVMRSEKEEEGKKEVERK